MSNRHPIMSDLLKCEFICMSTYAQTPSLNKSSPMTQLLLRAYGDCLQGKMEFSSPSSTRSRPTMKSHQQRDR